MKKSKKIFAWCLLLLWMSVIFIMSNQPAEISNSQSDFVIKLFGFLGINLNEHFGDLASLIVRKGAHITEYFILFLLAYRVISIYIQKRSSRIYSLLFVFLYACSDEIHQHFVPGRAMALKDVFIDTSGAIIGVIITTYYNKYKNRKNEDLNKKLVA